MIFGVRVGRERYLGSEDDIWGQSKNSISRSIDQASSGRSTFNPVLKFKK